MSKNPARCINTVFFSKKGSNSESVSIHNLPMECNYPRNSEILYDVLAINILALKKLEKQYYQ